jgi:hypothetical protein
MNQVGGWMGERVGGWVGEWMGAYSMHPSTHAPLYPFNETLRCAESNS